MKTAILRPNGTVSNDWTINYNQSEGLPAAHTVIADDAREVGWPGDSYYLYNFPVGGNYGSATVKNGVFNLNDITLDANTKIYAIRLRMRWGFSTDLYSAAIDHPAPGAVSCNLTLNGTTYVGGSGPLRSPPWAEVTALTLSNADGSPLAFTQTQINAAQVTLSNATHYHANKLIYVTQIWLEVDYNTPPVIGTTLPNATVTNTSRPSFTYPVTDFESDTIVKYEARLFNAAQYNFNFNVDTSEALWTSGQVNTQTASGTSLVIPPGVDLPSGTTYRQYVRVQDSHGTWSPWVYAWALVETPTLAIPFVPAATPDNPFNRMTLSLQGQDNMLSANDSTFDSAIGSWVGFGNATISRVTGVTGANGSTKAVLRIASNAAGDSYAGTGQTTTPVTVGARINAYAYVKTITATAREFRVGIQFYTSANAYVTAAWSGNMLSRTDAYVLAGISAVVPATAAYARVYVQIVGATAANEYHYVDQAGIAPGHFNLIENPIFQRDVDGNNFPDSYEIPVYVNNNRTDVDTTKYVIGDRSIKLVSSPSGASLSQTVRFARSQVYTLETYLYAETAGTVFELTVGSGYTYNGANNAGTDWTYTTSSGIPRAIINTANKWVKVSITVTTINAAQLNGGTVKITNVSSNVTGWVGALMLAPVSGTGTLTNFRANQWTPGGLTSVLRLELQRRVGTGAWQRVKTFPYEVETTTLNHAHLNIVLRDYFAPTNTDVQYRIRATGTSGGQTINSAWFIQPETSKLNKLTKVWLKSTTNPDNNMIIMLDSTRIQRNVQRRSVTQYPLGAQAPVTITGRLKARNFPFSILCRSTAEAKKVETLLNEGAAKLLQLPKEELYVSAAGDYGYLDWQKGDDDVVITGTFQEVRTP